MDADRFLNTLEGLLKQAGLQTAFIEGQEPQIGHCCR